MDGLACPADTETKRPRPDISSVLSEREKSGRNNDCYRSQSAASASVIGKKNNGLDVTKRQEDLTPDGKKPRMVGIAPSLHTGAAFQERMCNPGSVDRNHATRR